MTAATPQAPGTDAEFAALAAGTVVVTATTRRRYHLTEFIPASSGVVAMWWATPVGGGRRRRLMLGDFTAGGWKVAEVPATEAAPAHKLYGGTVDYVINTTSTTRHYVRGTDGAHPLGMVGVTVLCGRTINGRIVKSEKLDPWGYAARLTTCRNCSRKAVVLNLVTRERAAELDAAAAEQSAPPVPAEAPAVEPEPAPAVTPAPAPATTIETRIRAAYRQLAGEPGAWVILTRLRPHLTGFTRAEQDEALRMINRCPDANIVPESNQKTLTDQDRAAAVHFGGQDKHLLAIFA